MSDDGTELTRLRQRLVAMEAELAYAKARLAHDLTARESAAQRALDDLAKASIELNASLEVSVILERLTDLLVPDFADWCAVYLQADPDTVDLAAVKHRLPEKTALLREEFRRYPRPHGAKGGYAKVIQTRLPELIERVPEDGFELFAVDATHLDMLKRIGPRSLACAPLVAHDRVLGAVVVGRSESDARYDRADLSFVEELARRAAVAIDNARLFAAVDRERRNTELLQAITAAMAGARTSAEVAEVAVTMGREATGADRAIVAAVTAGDTLVEAMRVEGYPEDVAAAWQKAPLSAPSPLSDVVRTGSAVFFESKDAIAAAYAAYPRGLREGEPGLEGDRPKDDEAAVFLPLSVEGRRIGALGFTFARRRRFALEERGYFQALARLAAQALDRTNLFELAQAEGRRAEAANRAKDEFLGMVSHELRTPLSSILGWSKLLQGGAHDAAKLSRGLEVIERNARAQAQLIDDLLDITRVITGKLRLHIGPVDLPAIIRAAIESMRPAAEAKGVRLHALLDTTSTGLLGDPDRLQQIVFNLVSNAVKFTPKGGKVSARLRRVESQVEITVEDNGEGIAQGFLPYVFEKFRQAESGTMRSKGGLGMGLTIVKHLVELHGGTIVAESEGEGRGAAFSVRLPIAPVHAAAAPVAVSRAPRVVAATAVAAHPQGLEGLRVLVIDDEPDARELLRAVLESGDAVVATAASSQDALGQIAQAKPDLIVSDIGMPGEDGYLFMQRLRSLPPEGGGLIPAVALTAYARTEDRTRALLAGFNSHLSKPVDPAELLLVVATVSGQLLAR